MPPYCITNAPDAAPKPEGGFTSAPINHLLLVCQAKKQNLISIRGLRADCGLLVIKERRHAYEAVAGPGRPAHYGASELQKLMGTPRLSHAERAIEELTTSGLVPMTQTSMDFITTPQDVPGLDRTAAAARRAHVPATLHHVPFPRRFLSYLALEGSAGLIATAFSVALRCLRYHPRERLCTFGGTVSASNIVELGGVSERNAYRHLAELEALRWLITEDRPTWYVHKYGPWRLVNKDWTPPPTPSGSRGPRGRTAGARRPQQLPLFPPAATPAAGIPPTPDHEDACQPSPPPEDDGCQKMAVASCTNLAVSDLRNASNNMDSRSTSAIKPFQEISKHQIRKPAPPADATPASVSILQDLPTATTAALVFCSNEDREQANPHRPPVPWEALEAEYTILPYEIKAMLREEALTRLLEQGNLRDVIIEPTILTEICRGLATTDGHGDPVAPAPSAEPVPISPPMPTCEPPTQPTVPLPTCTGGEALGGHGQAKVPLAARHISREMLQDTGQVLAVYHDAVQEGLCTHSEPNQQKVLSLAEHALREGADPGALFAENLRHQRWHGSDADDDAAHRRHKVYKGIDPQGRRQPLPITSKAPALSADAIFVDLVLRVLPPAWRDRPFLAVKMQSPEWTSARWDHAVRELEQAQRAWKQAQNLNYLGDLSTEWDWLTSHDPEAEAGEPCPECGEDRESCACLPSADST